MAVILRNLRFAITMRVCFSLGLKCGVLLVIFIEKRYLAGWRLKKLQDKFLGYGQVSLSF
jgi:hypothetical protein